MKIYRSFDEIDYNKNTVLTLGTFDGVHQGHQLMLKYLRSSAAENNHRALLITIDPHPQIILKKENKPPVELLTTIDERIELFEKFGLNHLLIIPFTLEFSKTKPEEFVKSFLYQKVGIEKIIVGYDHLFGKNRSGDINLLNNLGKQLGFSVEKVNPYHEEGKVISSTIIRKHLKLNEIEKANQMLGYDYFVTGKVVRGQGRAKSLGYPTANIKPETKHKLYPANGVYLISSYIDGNLYHGMANIGLRPTLTNDTEPTLEVNFFNLDMDLYDKVLQIQFIRFIRKEHKFESVPKLLEQISTDKKTCLNLIKQTKK